MTNHLQFISDNFKVDFLLFHYLNKIVFINSNTFLEA